MFDRKLEAEQFLTGVEHSKLTGAYVDPALGRITLARFVDEDYRRTMLGLEPSTRATNESYLRSHVLPVFGNRPLATIDYAGCQAWVNEMATRKAAATVVKAAQIMGKVMKTAVRARRISHNPMAEVTLPAIEESEDVYLTPAQVETLADAIPISLPATEPSSGWAATADPASASCWPCDGRISTSCAGQ